ncbi:hypothetical protein NDU88_004653 [Pleurodeles waltl]|uniref:Uncharacterized protein n=1 Tax=Pleurodeles waltl TaxID=8319 RepID=A0AAV7RGB9_PLEWA|nr:hypothetical protein NDU88_004653 [Pleurodeles waltl]
MMHEKKSEEKRKDYFDVTKQTCAVEVEIGDKVLIKKPTFGRDAMLCIVSISNVEYRAQAVERWNVERGARGEVDRRLACCQQDALWAAPVFTTK